MIIPLHSFMNSQTKPERPKREKEEEGKREKNYVVIYLFIIIILKFMLMWQCMA